MTDLSFMERRVQQLNVEAVSKQNLEAKMSELPMGSKLLDVLVEAHNAISIAQWNELRGRDA